MMDATAGSAGGAGTATSSRLSAGKRIAILAAAEPVFLRGGYVGTNVDEIAAAAGVSKPTVYRHFGSKEGLFVALVTEMTTRAGDGLHDDLPVPTTREELRAVLTAWATRQLKIVLTPRLMQVRRLVIGEVPRFPDLARALYEAGPRRAITTITGVLRDADARGLALVPDPEESASLYNWLVMGGPVNEAMLLGDDALGSPEAHARHAARCAEVLLAGHPHP